MMFYVSDKKKVLKTLKENPKGLSINGVAIEGELSWTSVKRELLILQQEGKVKLLLCKGYNQDKWELSK